jgi:hypothetical protein
MERYWISFDLGLQGDYRPLFEWLDRQDAKEHGDGQGAQECGENVATFRSDKTTAQIQKEIVRVLGGQKENARVYLIGRNEEGKYTGRFIVGKRRRSPAWKGFAEVESAGDSA